ncbi:hypothetical protein CR513_42772, partial [Mucuna pruriens]
MVMQWFSSLPPRTIHTFNNLVMIFAKDKSLKKYLARFNSTMVQVNDLDQKFFVKAFQKGLRPKCPSSMGEIRARAEKHVKAKEDQAN